MSIDDESLASDPTEVAEVVDATPALDADDFDWDAFLQGVRPTRRAVKVYGRADLVADMEEVAGQFRDDLPAAEKRRIRDEVLALRAQFEASGQYFVTEARSADRVDKVRKEAAARHGITLPAADATGEDAMIPRADYDKLERAILADAIVIPSGVTEQGLAVLAEQAPTEYPKLVVTMKAANTRLAQGAEVLTRDFSQGRSEGRGSSKR